MLYYLVTIQIVHEEVISKKVKKTGDMKEKGPGAGQTSLTN